LSAIPRTTSSNPKMPGLGGHLRVVDRLEEQVAEFPAQLPQACRSIASATS
jgi:hypothetical protein